MTKVSEVSNKDVSTTSESKLSRRDFFRKTAVYSAGAIAAANVVSPVKIKADDSAIINEAPWGQKLGDPIDKNLYGIPSPFEHNNIRRTHSLFSSGDYYASVSMCPIHESEGIVTPNGLFFTRNHGGTAHVDPNEWRLMINGKVKKEIVLTLDDLKRYPSESRIYFIECPANGAPEWRGPQFNSLQFMKGLMSAAEWTGVMLKTILEDVGLEKDAVWMLAEGSDNASNPRTIPVEKALDDVMVVWAQN